MSDVYALEELKRKKPRAPAARMSSTRNPVVGTSSASTDYPAAYVPKYGRIDLEVPLNDNNLTIVSVDAAKVFENGLLHIPVTENLKLEGLRVDGEYDEVRLLTGNPEELLKRGLIQARLIDAKSGSIIMDKCTQFSVDGRDSYATVLNETMALQFQWPSKRYLLSYYPLPLSPSTPNQLVNIGHAHLQLIGAKKGSIVNTIYCEKKSVEADIYYVLLLNQEKGQLSVRQHVVLNNRSSVDFHNVDTVTVMRTTLDSHINTEVESEIEAETYGLTTSSPSAYYEQSKDYRTRESRNPLARASSSVSTSSSSFGSSGTSSVISQSEAQKQLLIDFGMHSIMRHTEYNKSSWEVSGIRSILSYYRLPGDADGDLDTTPWLWLNAEQLEDYSIFTGRADLYLSDDEGREDRIGSSIFKDVTTVKEASSQVPRSYLLQFQKTSSVSAKHQEKSAMNDMTTRITTTEHQYTLRNKRSQVSAVTVVIDVTGATNSRAVLVNRERKEQKIAITDFQERPMELKRNNWKEINISLESGEEKILRVFLEHNM